MAIRHYLLGMVSVNNTTNNKDLQQALQGILVEVHISLRPPENNMKEQHNWNLPEQ